MAPIYELHHQNDIFPAGRMDGLSERVTTKWRRRILSISPSTEGYKLRREMTFRLTETETRNLSKRHCLTVLHVTEWTTCV